MWTPEGLGRLPASIVRPYGSATGQLGERATPTSPQRGIFHIPQDAAKVPNDRDLLAALGKIGTNTARALVRAFVSLGKPQQFAAALHTALRTLPLPGEGLQRYEMYLARLGAEAFMLGLNVSGDKPFHVGFVDHPVRLRDALTLAQQEYFLHFSIRRLLTASSSAAVSDAHRAVLACGTALFKALQAELGREYRLIGIPETLLVAYRRLLVAIIWKHYQLQLDHVLAKARGAQLRFVDVLKVLEDLLQQATVTLVHDAHTTIPTFHTGSREYRDYFTPSARTDIGFTYFSRTARPATDHEPQMSFRTLVRRRRQQKALLADLQQRSHPRLPPKLHDSASWQVWLREMWDGNWRQLPPKARMAETLQVVGQYFEAFTAHVPHDLKEGCSAQNYLTRVFPRAITGALVHDCAVYAIRWLHILGRLVAPKAPPTGFKASRLFLIEMPSHVGVMIRTRILVGGDILVSINNKHAQMHDLDPAESDAVAATMVVQDQYQGPKTPCVIRPLTASPADATSLWREVCRIYEKKWSLPYADVSEPHLRYLAYNAGIGRVARQLVDTVGGFWLDLQRRLAAARARNRLIPPERVQEEIKLYGRAVETAVKAASDSYQKDMHPLITEIHNDLRVNQHRLPKGAIVVETAVRLKPWESAWIGYRPELQKAVTSRDISQINPEKFFPEDDFVAAVA